LRLIPPLLLILCCLAGLWGCNFHNRPEQQADLQRLSHQFRTYQRTPIDSRQDLPFANRMHDIFKLLCSRLAMQQSTYDDVVRLLGHPRQPGAKEKAPREVLYDLSPVSGGLIRFSEQGRYMGYIICRDTG